MNIYQIIRNYLVSYPTSFLYHFTISYRKYTIINLLNTFCGFTAALNTLGMRSFAIGPENLSNIIHQLYALNPGKIEIIDCRLPT